MNSLPVTRSPACRPGRLAVSTALLAFASTAQGATVLSYFDGTFSPADWSTVVTAVASNATFTAQQAANLGNPGNWKDIRLVSSQTPGGGTSRPFVLYAFHSGFVWDAAVNGPLGQVSLELDLRLVNSAPQGSVFIQPALLQDGLEYFLSTNTVPAARTTDAAWNTFRFDAGPEGWIVRGGSGPGPDFSSSGSPIQFGFRAGITLTCNAPETSVCTSTNIVTGLDNYNLTLTVVPLPAAGWLLGSGLLGLAVLRRRSRP
jgi:hypothetical protein